MSSKKPVEKSYRLKDSRSGESFMLKSGRDKRLLFFDEEKGLNRAIRHCPNEQTIYIDEQSEHALVDPILFINGILTVKPQDQITQLFLNCHPDNGTWFEEINDEKEAGEDIELEELITEIKQTVRAKGEEKDGVFALEMVASILLDSLHDAAKMTPSELKRVIYQKADSNPYYFTDDAGNINIFDDEFTQRKYLVLRAIKDNVIKKSPNRKSILWTKGNQLIATAPQGVDLVEFFADYLATDEGILVIEEIQKRS